MLYSNYTSILKRTVFANGPRVSEAVDFSDKLQFEDKPRFNLKIFT